MMASELAETCRFINTNKLAVFDVPYPLLTVFRYFNCIVTEAAILIKMLKEVTKFDSRIVL